MSAGTVELAGDTLAPDVRCEQDWTLAHAAAARAVDRRDHPAIVCEDRVVTFGEVYARSRRIAAALRRDGVGSGDRVAYLARESEHYYTAILACAAVGAVLVPVNWRLTAPEVAHVLSDSGAVLVFAESEFRAAVTAAVPVVTLDRPDGGADGGAGGGVENAADGGLDRDDHGAGLRAWYADADADSDAAASPPGAQVRPDDPVVQIYTSGTTGLPKGVVLAHRSFFTLPAASARQGVAWLDWLADDVNLISLPGLGIAGIGWFMHGYVAGATSVLMRAFEPQLAVRLMAEHGVTTTFAAPAMLGMILAERRAGPETFAALRKVAYGAAPMPEDLLVRCRERFGCELVQIYSSTEAGSVAVCLPPAEHEVGNPRLRSVGRACPGNEVQIVDATGRVLPVGEIGQVRVWTPAKMLGYWRRPEATAETLRDGWLHMGDAGYLDADGYLYLCDRIADTIIVAGQNVYPAEVERELRQHPAIADVAVVALPDPELGDRVHAAVVPAGDERPTARELATFLATSLASFKIPTGVTWVEALPRNPSGKVLRREVRAQLTAGGAA